ncbi:MAG: Crp/Fnr family transcriptional regulator, partial [Verrucomicrobia bacterium]|nr:Crp/Fnr family transcriptional regulator [Cytophagales bacterium]
IMYEQLTEFIKQFVDPNPEQLDYYLSHYTCKVFKKGDYLCKAGEVCQECFFINKGIVRKYKTGNKRDLTTWFFFENGFATENSSFYTQTVAQSNLKTVTEVEALVISYESMQAIYANGDCIWEKFGRLVAEQATNHVAETMIGLVHKSAKGKYEAFINQRPNILKHIPLLHISSYIGVALETVSRIRKNR